MYDSFICNVVICFARKHVILLENMLLYFTKKSNIDNCLFQRVINFHWRALLFTGWRFGAVMCKVTPFLQGVAVSASVNTLTAIALDR